MGHLSWRNVKNAKRKEALASKIDALSVSIQEFINNCHDPKDGRFCETEEGVPKHELPHLGDIPPEAHDEVKHLLRSRRAVEPEITDTLVGTAERFGAKMLGLKYKFKKAEGVVEKVNRKVAEKGIDHEKAAAGISDALRYTMELPGKNYAKGAASAIKALEKAGYEFLEVENNWDGPPTRDAYQGVNAVFKDPKTGLKVELQFHTKESWHTKDVVIHEDYEYVRERRGTPASRLVAAERMRQASAKIPIPDGVDDFCAEVGDKCKDIVRPNRESFVD